MRLLLRGIGSVIGTIAIYLGLSLLGWGDLHSFFASPARAAYAIVAIAFGVAVGYQAIVAPEGIHGGKGREEKLVRRQTILGALLVYVLFTGLLFFPYADRRGIAVWATPPAVQWFGVILAACGYLLVFLSGWYLGRQYSAEVTLQEGHQLITNGPYRYVRHPRYLGVIFLALGFSLLFRSWVGLGLTAVVFALLLLRIKDEEALLLAEFGEEWIAYCHRTKKLFPFVY